MKSLHPLRLLAAALACAAAWSAQAETLKLGHVTPPSHVWHKIAVKIDQNLQAKSGGNMKLAVSPLSKLGSEGLMMDMLRSGAMPMAILTAGSLSNREPAFLGWSMPYLFRDVKHATAAAATPAAQEMLGSLDKHGMIGMGYAFAGMRHVLSLTPVNHPDDLKNRKIRAFPNPVYKDYWRGNGAAPTPLPLSEVAPALTTKLLDAVDIDLDALVGMKFHHQAPYLTMSNHMAFPAVIVVSKRYWDGLDERRRRIVREAVKEAELWGYEQAAAAEEKNLQAALKDGVKLQQADLQPFTRIGADVAERYRQRHALLGRFYREARALQP
ncbi:TRAP transporter substrate-binding protein [Bergeriella denitrificans]|uniref:TRAP-type mannitol/chloroaromatic compound transport system, periplasmic component n=1 Tax=Bergeriella denitrificans TaxID=494 RepID=A0A378UKH5_BERDE|nr:TRAP transporter substrate-binding protein [Bergeriella denitrificans]STZ77149.1 TRAP-type mannitol/chloroaromatic compound transport system, periplasmic component [Bergeriella denitrificans]